MDHYFGGLSGLQLPIPRYQYPEAFRDASRLRYYASIFNSIEINSSFYKIPQLKTIGRWHEEVPAAFRFTFKLFKDLTHCKDLAFDARHIDSFIEAIDRAADKKACILIQFPPSLTTANVTALERLMRGLHPAVSSSQWQLAVEFRNSGWYGEDIFDILQMHDAILVRHDIPKSATPFSAPVGNVVYLRFHGPTGNYRGSYDKAFLAEHAGYVREMARGGKDGLRLFQQHGGRCV